MKLFSICVKVRHEPISPTESTTFLGTKVLRLPSFFQYVKEFEKMIVHSFFMILHEKIQHYFQYIKNYLNVSFEEIVTWLALCLQLEESNRAIINQMLEANWDCLFFTFLVVGLKNPCHPLNKSDAKLEPKFQLSHMHFPTLPAVCFFHFKV